MGQTFLSLKIGIYCVPVYEKLWIEVTSVGCGEKQYLQYEALCLNDCKKKSEAWYLRVWLQRVYQEPVLQSGAMYTSLRIWVLFTVTISNLYHCYLCDPLHLPRNSGFVFTDPVPYYKVIHSSCDMTKIGSHDWLTRLRFLANLLNDLKYQTHYYVQCFFHTKLNHFQHPSSLKPNILHSQTTNLSLLTWVIT